MTNLMLADEIEAIARNNACAAAQVALAWVMAQGDHVLTFQVLQGWRISKRTLVVTIYHWNRVSLTL